MDETVHALTSFSHDVSNNFPAMAEQISEDLSQFVGKAAKKIRTGLHKSLSIAKEEADKYREDREALRSGLRSFVQGLSTLKVQAAGKQQGGLAEIRTILGQDTSTKRIGWAGRGGGPAGEPAAVSSAGGRKGSQLTGLHGRADELPAGFSSAELGLAGTGSSLEDGTWSRDISRQDDEFLLPGFSSSELAAAADAASAVSAGRDLSLEGGGLPRAEILDPGAALEEEVKEERQKEEGDLSSLGSGGGDSIMWRARPAIHGARRSSDATLVAENEPESSTVSSSVFADKSVPSPRARAQESAPPPTAPEGRRREEEAVGRKRSRGAAAREAEEENRQQKDGGRTPTLPTKAVAAASAAASAAAAQEAAEAAEAAADLQ